NERPVDAPHTGRGPRHARERTGGGSPVVRRPWTPTLRIVGETPTYDRLSGLDESFLHLERAGTPMHVGAVAVLERDPFVEARGLFRLGAVRELVASRLQLIPRFRKRVMTVPLGHGRPVWVDDADFDIARHVRLTSLPSTGRREQLLDLAARLMSQPLDRAHP